VVVVLPSPAVSASSRHQDELRVGTRLETVEVFERHLRLEMPVGLEVLFGNAELRKSDLGDAFERAFCAISMSEAINCSLCCGTASCFILWARHYKGCAFHRTLTEIKIQAARTRGEAPVEQCPVHRCSLPSGMMKSKPFLQRHIIRLTRGGVSGKENSRFLRSLAIDVAARMADDDHPARFPRDATFHDADHNQIYDRRPDRRRSGQPLHHGTRGFPSRCGGSP